MSQRLLYQTPIETGSGLFLMTMLIEDSSIRHNKSEENYRMEKAEKDTSMSGEGDEG
jgi:hypothetical protein